MKLISISEFLNLTKLSERQILAMLENGELTTKNGPLGEVLIDLENVSPESLAKSTLQRERKISENDLALLEETIASELMLSLSEIVDEAFELALTWQSESE